MPEPSHARNLNHRIVLIALIVVMALVLAACGAGQPQNAETGEDAPPAEPVVEEPEAPAEEEAEPAEEEAPPAADEPPAEEEAEPEPAEGDVLAFEGLSPADLDSYVADISFDFEGTDSNGEAVSMSQVMTMNVQSDPIAMSMTIESLDVQGAELGGMGMEDGSMAFFVTEETVSMQMGDMCLAFPVEEGDVSSEEMFGEAFLDPAEIAAPGSEIPELTYVGKETVNGQNARHYQITQADLENLHDATVDVWVVDSPAGEYATRAEITGTAGSEEFMFGDATSGQVTLVFNITSVNEPVVVTPPANCQEFIIPDMPEGSVTP